MTSSILVDKVNLAMFVLNQQLKRISASIEEVAYLASSINRPVVVLPGESPEPAQAYICIVRKEKGYEVYIYLHLIHSNRPIIYQWDQGAVSRSEVSAVQQEALSFTESMGFMMSDLRWRELAPAEREDLYNSIPLFFEDLSRFKEEVEEEILEIEPAEEEELVVEPIEETPETVTEGDFVLDESAFAEEGGQAEAQELPEIKAPEQVPEQAGVSEEDILLDQLEVKEEQVSSPPPPAPEVSIEIEEESEAEAVPEQVPVSEPPAPEVVSEPELKEPAPASSAPEPQEEEEEILINLEAEPSPAPPQPAEEQAREEPVSTEEQVEEVVISAPEEKELKPETQKPAPEQVREELETALSEEEKELIARLLAMF